MISTVLSILNNSYGFELQEISRETSFVSLQDTEQSFDSLTRIQFLIDVEDALNIRLPANAKVDCIADIERLIEG